MISKRFEPLLLFALVLGVASVDYTVLDATIPHDSTTVSQGLYYDASSTSLIEGFGDFLTCKLTISDLTGARPHSFDYCQNQTSGIAYWGAGFAVSNSSIYQLLWKAQKIIKYSIPSLSVAQVIPITGEGWGLTHDDQQSFIRSDGTNVLTFLDHTFKVSRTLTVQFADGAKENRLNKLMWYKGEIWATLMSSMDVVRISPDGTLLDTLNFTALASGANDFIVGIASLPNDNFLVTGRKWKAIRQITYVPVQTLPPTTSPSKDSSTSMAMNQTSVQTSASVATVPQESTSAGNSTETKTDTDSTVVPQAVVLGLVIVAKGLAFAAFYFNRLPVQ